MLCPGISHDGPPSGLVRYWIGRLWMGLFRWKVAGEIPAGGKFVLIAAPHTSNWDLPFMLAAACILRIKVSWMGKDTLFRKPFGGFMRWLGGIAINRAKNHGVVDQVAEQFGQPDPLVVAVPVSGTRKKTDYWKSGFYWIAHTAQVPIVCGYLDYHRKAAGLGLSFVPTGDVKADMDRIREFYEGIQGKYPALTATIRLRDEQAQQVVVGVGS